MTRKITIVFLLLGLISIYNTGFASEYFSITPNGTSITIKSLTSNHTYEHAAIKIDSTGYSFTDPQSDCINNQDGYCVFSVSDTLSKNIKITGPQGTANIIMCLSAAANPPEDCQNYKVTISPIPNRLVYVSSAYGLGLNTLQKCELSSSGDAISDCNLISRDFSNPYDIVMHPKKLSLYVTNSFDRSLSQCFLNANGGLTTCLKFYSLFNRPLGITITPAGNYLYLPFSDNNTVTKCTLATNGAINGCRPSGYNMSMPTGIVLNKAGTIIYVSNHQTNTITMCELNEISDLTNCHLTAENSGLDKPTGLAISVDNKYLYAVNDETTHAIKCVIGASGALTSCTETGSGFLTPQKIKINQDNTKVYVTNSEPGLVSMCDIDSAGDWQNCQTILTDIFGASGLEIAE